MRSRAVLITLFLTVILVGAQTRIRYPPFRNRAHRRRTRRGGRDDHVPVPPAGLVTVPFGGDELTWWPYTVMDFSGDPVDPGNLIFAGQADPLRIRAALLALNGDRTAFGFPMSTRSTPPGLTRTATFRSLTPAPTAGPAAPFSSSSDRTIRSGGTCGSSKPVMRSGPASGRSGRRTSS